MNDDIDVSTIAEPFANGSAGDGELRRTGRGQSQGG